MDVLTRIFSSSGLMMVLGAWLFLSSFIGDVPGGVAADVNFGVVGSLILIFAGIRAFGNIWAVGFAWSNAVLGLWMMVSPWVFRYVEASFPFWNSVLAGLAVLGLGIWSATAPLPRRRRAVFTESLA